MTRFAVSILLAIMSHGCAGQTCLSASDKSSAELRAPEYVSPMEVASFAGKPDSSVVIYDANPKDMYLERHVPGARWIDYDAVNASLLPVDRRTRLIFYCANRQCSASTHAAQRALALGWTHVAVMSDGIFGWVAADFPTEPG